ncbi:MAG: rhodanese-like domain-containing protein [Bacteroidota bacterium]
MNRNKFLLIGVFILSISIIFFAQSKSVPEMKVSELKQAMKSDSTLVILDVRTKEELTGELGKIDDVINIPVQELENRISELKKYKKNNIAVICRSGRRSAVATELLNKNGFKAKSVAGGMIEYREHEAK